MDKTDRRISCDGIAFEKHFTLGLDHARDRNFAAALEEFYRALALGPDNARCLLEIAKLHFRQRRYKEAREFLSRVLAQDPSHAEARQYMEEIEKPDFCVIEVSHRCMFRCKMCNYWQTSNSQVEVDIPTFCRFVDALTNFVHTPFEMNISGGEPLLKEGVLDLVECIAARGFRFSLVTNGFMIDKAKARRIADSGLNFLAISLDSLAEGTHDYIRGMPGAHKKVMEALGYFSSYRGKLQNITLQTILMGPTMEGVLDLVEWANTQQLSLSFMAVTRPNMVAIDPQWYRREDMHFLWPTDITRMHSILDRLIALKRSGYRIDNPIGQLERFKLYFSDPETFVKETPCSLGDDFMHVNPHGEIHLCCEMEPIGNITQGTDIGKMWASKQAQRVRENIRRCKRNCAGMVNCYREGD